MRKNRRIVTGIILTILIAGCMIFALKYYFAYVQETGQYIDLVKRRTGLEVSKEQLLYICDFHGWDGGPYALVVQGDEQAKDKIAESWWALPMSEEHLSLYQDEAAAWDGFITVWKQEKPYFPDAEEGYYYIEAFADPDNPNSTDRIEDIDVMNGKYLIMLFDASDNRIYIWDHY